MNRYEELEEKRSEVYERMMGMVDKAKAEKRDLTKVEMAEFNAAEAALKPIVDEMELINERARNEAREAIQSGKGIMSNQNAEITRSAADSTLDLNVRSGYLSADAASNLQRLTKAENYTERNTAQAYVRSTGDPAYLTAFSKLVADPQRGHMLWTPEEREAYQAVAEVRTALNLTSGADLLPLSLDPTINLENNSFANSVRSIARVVQTISNQHRMITSQGTTAEWKTELSEAADATPSISDVDILLHYADAYAMFSHEISVTAAGEFVQQVQRILVDAWANLTNQAYVTGTGSGQPKGFVTGISAVSGSVVASVGTEALVSADVYNTQAALPPRYQNDSTWVMSLPIANKLRQMETTNGSLEFPELRNTVPTLLGRPLTIISEMDSTINPAATETNYVLALGDFGDEFVIVDRIGMQVELIQNVVGTNARPVGARGLLLWGLTGSDILSANAFRVLNVATTAP